jgi:hypothetical protein
VKRTTVHRCMVIKRLIRSDGVVKLMVLLEARQLDHSTDYIPYSSCESEWGKNNNDNKLLWCA